MSREERGRKPRHTHEVPIAPPSILHFPLQKEILKIINRSELIGTYEQVDEFFVRLASLVADKIFNPYHTLTVWLESLEANSTAENQLKDLVNDSDFEKFVRLMGADDLFVERAESYREQATRLLQLKAQKHPRGL